MEFDSISGWFAGLEARKVTEENYLYGMKAFHRLVQEVFNKLRDDKNPNLGYVLFICTCLIGNLAKHGSLFPDTH